MGTHDEDSGSRPSTASSHLTTRTLEAYSAPLRIDALDDWSQLRARIQVTPEDSQSAACFPRRSSSSVPEVHAPRARYLPFSNYPMAEYLELMLEAARLRYPKMTAGDAVLQLGSHVYTTFVSSLAGMAIFSIAQLDFRRSVELAPKAYEVTLKPGRVNVLHVGTFDAQIELRDVWALPDIFHAGIWLGGMAACKTAGSIRITRHSLCDVDFDLKWGGSRR